MDEIEGTIGIKFTTEDVTKFKPFFMLLKENIKNTQDVETLVSQLLQ